MNTQIQNEQLNRMKQMMTYGLTENKKKTDFASLEYHKVAGDGKTYGIVREGTKYYIKVSNNSKELIKENFEYIGGFRNRKDFEYTSYANALKNFDMKMRSINEAHANNGKKLIAESWNPEKQEFVMVEATEKMRNEIARQRQIMQNASVIFEGKDGCCDGSDCSCQTKNEKKDGAKKGQYNMGTGDAEKANGTGFEEDAPKNLEDMPNLYQQVKTNVKEGKDNGTLAWHQTGGDAKSTIADTYLDTSHGTEIGDSAPFDKCPKGDSKSEMHNGTVEEENDAETVEEGKSMAMDCGDNQNDPAVGVGEVGDDAPFDKGVKKGIQEAEEGEEPMDDAPMGGEEPMGDEGAEDMPMDDETEGAPMGDDSMDDMGAEEPMDDDMEGDDDMDFGDDEDLDPELEDDEEIEASDDSNEIASLRNEIDSLKDLVASVAEKLGVSSSEIADSEFADDSLYDDDEVEDDTEDFGDEGEPMNDDYEGEDEFGAEDEEGDFDFSDDEDADSDEYDDEDEDETVFESRSYKRMKRLNEENRLDMFGKHPAYRKVPMQLPPTGEDKNSHGKDWNNDSVYSESPYGEKIGSGAPFDIDPAEIENAIAESVRRVLGRRKRL